MLLKVYCTSFIVVFDGTNLYSFLQQTAKETLQQDISDLLGMNDDDYIDDNDLLPVGTPDKAPPPYPGSEGEV